MPRVPNSQTTKAAWLLVGSLAALAGAAGFEAPATLQASKVLPASLVKGPHYSVAEAVKVEGHYQQFQITSDYGNLTADGRTMLKTRVVEVDALARLDEVSKSEVFAQAAGGAVLNVGKGVKAAVKDPGATAKGIGGGVKRLGTNLGRKGKSAAQSATAEKPAGQSETQAATNAAPVSRHSGSRRSA